MIALAQNVSRENAFIEELIDAAEDESLAEDLSESLLFLLERPMDLNEADRDDLDELFFLLPQQVEGFLAYREKNGRLLSIYELAAIEAFDEETIRRLEPFVFVSDLPEFRKKSVNHSLTVRIERTIEKKTGFERRDDPEANGYMGSPYRRLLKYRSYSRGAFSVGATAETDPGEQVMWNPKARQYGPDFLSFHYAVENKGIVNAFIIGDYKLDIGQGLSLGHSYWPGKTSMAVQSVRRSPKGLKPYTGGSEFNFFRGAAASIRLSGTTVSPFFSCKKRDGRLEYKDNNPFAVSLPTAGLHRTVGERSIRKSVLEMVYGMDIQYAAPDRRFEAGFNVFATELNAPALPEPSTWNQFAFRGESLVNCGLRMNYTIRRFSFFNELAASDYDRFAGISGLQAILSPTISFAAAYRNYGRAYHAFYASAFSESAVQNEEGFYWGADISLKKGWRVYLYYDLFRFPWLKYQAYAPSTGTESLFRVKRVLKNGAVFYFQFKTEHKGRNADADQAVVQTENVRRNQFQLNYDASPLAFLNLRFGVRMNHCGSKAGIVAVQDCNLELGKFKWSSRIGFFDAEEYDNRLYFHERDMLSAFSFPAYFGKGFRFYSLLEYHISDGVRIWCRVARSKYSDREETGSGFETINADHKTDLKLQVAYRF